MKKQAITATDIGKKTYAQPRMRVVEIVEESLLCQSGGGSKPTPQSSNEKYEEESTSDWFNN